MRSKAMPEKNMIVGKQSSENVQGNKKRMQKTDYLSVSLSRYNKKQPALKPPLRVTERTHF